MFSFRSSAVATALVFASVVPVLRAQPGEMPQYDQAAIERGKTSFIATCGFCHGSSARGGEGGPDLLRSVLVLDDEGGRQLGAFLRKGRPVSGMPAFQIPQQQITDIATFLHSSITAAAYRKTYRILNILVGDAKDGEEYFNGAGKCNACHSPDRDLKGIGARYSLEELQGKIVMPRAPRPPGVAPNALPQPPAVAVTVTLPSGESVRGDLVRYSDFYVTLRDSTGATRTFARNGDVPKVEFIDPLQAHIDLLGKYTDKNIHDLTAYLVTFK
jgi:cytochrome c oxidase cbb3-type subunit III